MHYIHIGDSGQAGDPVVQGPAAIIIFRLPSDRQPWARGFPY
jgi:hypothetical protein